MLAGYSYACFSNQTFKGRFHFHELPASSWLRKKFEKIQYDAERVTHEKDSFLTILRIPDECAKKFWQIPPVSLKFCQSQLFVQF